MNVEKYSFSSKLNNDSYDASFGSQFRQCARFSHNQQEQYNQPCWLLQLPTWFKSVEKKSQRNETRQNTLKHNRVGQVSCVATTSAFLVSRSPVCKFDTEAMLAFGRTQILRTLGRLLSCVFLPMSQIWGSQGQLLMLLSLQLRWRCCFVATRRPGKRLAYSRTVREIR